VSDYQTKIKLGSTDPLNPSDRLVFRDFVNISGNAMYHRHGTRSEPCQTPPCLDSICSAPLPPLKAMVELNQSQVTRFKNAPISMLHKPGLASRRYRLEVNGRCHKLQKEPALYSSNCKTHSSGSHKSSRSKWKRIFMAPVNGIAWLMEKFCFKPSDECLQCVQMTYFLVLILGAIISAAVTIMPFI